MPLLSSLFYELTYHYPSRLNRAWMGWYPYMFTPAQLIFLCECVRSTADIAGPILEVGVARGNTTILLNKYMDDLGIEKEYLAIDTFSGFTAPDVEFEISARKKSSALDWSGFGNNKKAWFDKSMQLAKVGRVSSIAADASIFAYPEHISFCLLDVDLYRPTRAALSLITPNMAPGGIIVIDDCSIEEGIFDGAAQAYREHCAEWRVAPELVHNKLGVLRF